MKYIIPILLLGIAIGSLQGQSEILTQKGTVSFVSTKNVYVKFDNTKALKIGDTLFFNENSNIIPSLVITNKSSTSTVCTKLTERKFQKGDEIIATLDLS